MAATGSFHSVSSLALGSGPCRACFIALLKAHGEAGAEAATWKSNGHANS
jgi:hypothetical protein